MKYLRLTHYETGSTITLLEENRHLGSLSYSTKAHKHFAEIEYKSLVTEMNTYGDNAVMELFTYYQDKQIASLKSEIAELEQE